MVDFKDQRAEMLVAAERILDGCDAEDRNMTNEETKHFDTLLFRVDHLEEFETYKKYSGFSDELIWNHLERRAHVSLFFNNAYQRKRLNEIHEQQSEKGKKKRGHEGPLKLLLRDIMGNRKMRFDQVTEALGTANHLMVDDFDGETLAYTRVSKSGEEISVEVKLPAIRRAYREIIKTTS